MMAFFEFLSLAGEKRWEAGTLVFEDGFLLWVEEFVSYAAVLLVASS